MAKRLRREKRKLQISGIDTKLVDDFQKKLANIDVIATKGKPKFITRIVAGWMQTVARDCIPADLIRLWWEEGEVAKNGGTKYQGNKLKTKVGKAFGGTKPKTRVGKASGGSKR